MFDWFVAFKWEQGCVVFDHDVLPNLLLCPGFRMEPAQASHPDFLSNESPIIVWSKLNLPQTAAVSIWAEIQNLENRRPHLLIIT